MFVAAVVFSLFFFSLSLSSAGETHSPSRGFGVPLVFLRPGRALRSRPVRLARLLHLGVAPAPVFLFVARVGLWSVLLEVGLFFLGGLVRWVNVCRYN